MNPPSAALLEYPAAQLAAASGVAAASGEVERDLAMWGCPGTGRDGGVGEPTSEQDEVATALAKSYTRAFARRRQADGELVRLASASLELTDATVSAGIGARIASRRADRDVADSIAEIGLISTHEALRICRVARGIGERATLLGERLPAPYERVREAFESHDIPVDSAYAIIVALEEARTRTRTDAETLENFAVAELRLVQFAGENPADQVRSLAALWRDALDVDGVEPREKALTELTSLHRFVRANGMKRYVLDADPVAAAYLDAVIDGHVGTTIRRPRFDAPESDPSGGALEDTRSIGQIAAESIVQLARHGIACTNTEIPVRATSIVVRLSLESLLSGLGPAHIDGTETPISAGRARIMAADAEIIPEVLGGKSEVLDLGTRQRLFSRAQRLAISERDGGCAFPSCGSPPTHTEAHHIRWWAEGGLTNLDNAVSVCSRHHHDIHRDGWEIQVVDNSVWFVPPDIIDVTRTPRRGGRLPDPELPNPEAARWSFLPD